MSDTVIKTIVICFTIICCFGIMSKAMVEQSKYMPKDEHEKETDIYEKRNTEG